MEFKICTKCEKELPATNEYFRNNKQGKNGLNSVCKQCEKKHRDEHKEDIKLRSDRYYKKNKDKILKRTNQYYYENQELYKNYRIEHRQHNIEYQKKYQKEYQKNHKDIKNKARMKRKYNLTSDEFNAMLENQNNKCAICGDELKEGLGGRAIDHCHNTNKVRGILCMKCNTQLGVIEKNKKMLKNMITYLEIHKAN